MKDPQWPLIQAVHAALKGLTLPVYTTLELGVDEYVLISQPTLNESRLSAACTAWEATLLFSVYTKFQQKGQVSVQPTLAVSNEVMGRLSGTTLSFGEFSTSPLRFQRINLSQRAKAGVVYVQDVMRVRFTVYAHLAAAPTPTPTQYGLTLSNDTQEGGSVSFTSGSSCSISFNEVSGAAGPPFDTVFVQGSTSSFATLTAEYMNQPFAFFDAQGTRYERDLAGKPLVFIDGAISI